MRRGPPPKGRGAPAADAVRRLMLQGLSPWWRKAARVDAGLSKVVLKA